jgi:vacuolar-type H+-ATPase subunit H
MDTILDYLDEIEEMLDKSKPVPFSNRVSIDRDKFIDIIEEIRLNLPIEIDKAQKIVSDHERIVGDARNKAGIILEEARLEAGKLADEHEVYKQALEQANEVIEKSKKDSREMRINAMEYADEILAKAEATLRDSMAAVNQSTRAIDDLFNNTLEIIYTNRQELRGNKR